jgi:hypothetical protein
LLQAIGIREIDHQETRVRRLQRAAKPGHRVRARDRGQIDELKRNILVRHHPCLRKLGGEGVGRGVRARGGEPRVQRRLAGVRRPEQRELRGTLGPDHEGGSAPGAAFLRALELLGEFLDAPLDVRLQMVGALVLRDDAQHLAQPLQALIRVACLAERGFHCPIFGRQVGGHKKRGQTRIFPKKRVCPGFLRPILKMYSAGGAP